jgi:hypothetical protein
MPSHAPLQSRPASSSRYAVVPTEGPHVGAYGLSARSSRSVLTPASTSFQPTPIFSLLRKRPTLPCANHRAARLRPGASASHRSMSALRCRYSGNTSERSKLGSSSLFIFIVRDCVVGGVAVDAIMLKLLVEKVRLGCCPHPTGGPHSDRPAPHSDALRGPWRLPQFVRSDHVRGENGSKAARNGLWPGNALTGCPRTPGTRWV